VDLSGFAAGTGSFASCRPSADTEVAVHCGGIVMPVVSIFGHLTVLPRTPVAVHERTASWLRSAFRPQAAVTRHTCRRVRSTGGEQEASVIPVWKKSSRRTAVSPGPGTVPLDRTTDEREADLERRLAALEAWEATFAERRRAAREILAAADQRDAVADARDLAADRREQDLDRAEFLAADGEYGNDWPERRAAAMDREHAKADRRAARRDRIALAQDCVGPSGVPVLTLASRTARR
jgi:hypothetical protein